MTLADTFSKTLNGETVAVAKLGDVVGDLAVNLLIAGLILTFGVWLSGWAATLARQVLGKFRRTEKDLTLQDFAASLARYLVLILTIIAVLRRLGVETASIVTLLGAASLAIGLALQGALSNVAAGVMILIFRPYRVGDTVTIAGKTGKVSHLDLFNTTIHDADNLKIVAPNGKALADVVVNFTDIQRRRIELNFGIGYEDDIGHAVDIAIRCAAEDPRILKDPAPWAKPTDLAPSSVTLTVRVWVRPADYWEARFDLLRRIKEAYDAEGVSLPYPTQATVEKPAPSPAPQSVN